MLSWNVYLAHCRKYMPRCATDEWLNSWAACVVAVSATAVDISLHGVVHRYSSTVWNLLYIHTHYIHTYIQTLDNTHNSQAQGLNLRRGRSLGGKRTVDINDKRTDGLLEETWMSWNCWEIVLIAVTCSKQMVHSSWRHVCQTQMTM